MTTNLTQDQLQDWNQKDLIDQILKLQTYTHNKTEKILSEVYRTYKLNGNKF
jgi:hypothetical protein